MAQTLRSAGARRGAISEQTLVLRGIQPQILLGQLSRVHVVGESQDSNPLGALSALEGGMNLAEPADEGSSIRAGQPMVVAPAVAPHAKNERLVAQVIRVIRGDFPQVTLEVRVRWPIQAGPLKGKWRKGAVLKAPVLTSLDLQSKAMQQNLAGYYLKPGDRIWAHLALDAQGQPMMDWVERRMVKKK